MSTTNGNGFVHAVRAREYCAAGHVGIEVWKYRFPLAPKQPAEEVRIRRTTGTGARELTGTEWTGVFERASGRHFEVLFWPAANAVVVAAANAVYIVDPGIPEHFSGVVAPVEISGVTFDESAEHMFVADSLRVYAFSSDRRLKWISEPLDGYDARFCGCGSRMLAVELKPYGPELDTEEKASVVRLRTEDGTVLRSRFRLARHYRMTSLAA